MKAACSEARNAIAAAISPVLQTGPWALKGMIRFVTIGAHYSGASVSTGPPASLT